MDEFIKFIQNTLIYHLNELLKEFGQKIEVRTDNKKAVVTLRTDDKSGIGLIFEVVRELTPEVVHSLARECYYWVRNGGKSMTEVCHVPLGYVGYGESAEVNINMFLDFGNGVKVPCRYYPFKSGRTSRVLAKLGTPFPEYRVAPGYPEKLKGVYGWPARWAEAKAEILARGSYKMMSSGYGRLAINPKAPGVQDPTPGAHWEAPGDHNGQTWPQCEL